MSHASPVSLRRRYFLFLVAFAPLIARVVEQSSYIFLRKGHPDKEQTILSKRVQEGVIKEAVGPIEKVEVLPLCEHPDIGSLLVGLLFVFAELEEPVHMVRVNSPWNSLRRRTLNRAQDAGRMRGNGPDGITWPRVLTQGRVGQSRDQTSSWSPTIVRSRLPEALR